MNASAPPGEDVEDRLRPVLVQQVHAEHDGAITLKSETPSG
jgi:hypothetical protein